MMLERITLPFPPSVNSLYNGGSKQKRFPSKQYKAWLKSCPPLCGHAHDGVILVYRYFFPDNRARDSENYVKAVSDYLVKSGVIRDDCWQCIKEMRLIPCGVDKYQPRVEIEIREAHG